MLYCNGLYVRSTAFKWFTIPVQYFPSQSRQRYIYSQVVLQWVVGIRWKIKHEWVTSFLPFLGVRHSLKTVSSVPSCEHSIGFSTEFIFSWKLVPPTSWPGLVFGKEFRDLLRTSMNMLATVEDTDKSKAISGLTYWKYPYIWNSATFLNRGYTSVIIPFSQLQWKVGCHAY